MDVEQVGKLKSCTSGAVLFSRILYLERTKFATVTKQSLTNCPAGGLVPVLRGRLTVQPVGDFPRKAISPKDQKDIVARANEVFDAGQLSVPGFNSSMFP